MATTEQKVIAYLVDGCLVQIKHGDGVAMLDQVGGHVPSHVTDANKTNLLRPPSSSAKETGRAARASCDDEAGEHARLITIQNPSI